jgi:hypothetical protein
LEQSAEHLNNASWLVGRRDQPDDAKIVSLASLCVIALFAATLAGILFQDVPLVLIPTGFCLLASSLFLVRSAAIQYLGTAKLLCSLFFALATLHIAGGFLLAGLTTAHTSIRSNEGTYYANSLMINGVGLLAAALGYAWKLSRNSLGLSLATFTSVNGDVAEKLFRVFAVTGSAIMFYIYWRLGFLDYLSNPAKWPFFRYITSDLLGGTATDEWFANRAMDLLTVSLPFLVYRLVNHRRSRLLNGLLVPGGCVALLLPLRRASLLGVLFASLILIGIGRHDVYRLTRRWLLTIGGLYVFSQCVFLVSVLAKDFNPQALLTVSSTALPEVRDLAWTLNRLEGQQLDGITFAQALIPLPSIASDWSAKHSLRAISTKLIGVDQTGESGGLRLTLMGEGFINFGYLGTITISFLWGIGVAWCEHLLASVEQIPSAYRNYVAVMCFVWICFLIYLAGTQAAASVKMGALLLLTVAWLSRGRLQSGLSIQEARA